MIIKKNEENFEPKEDVIEVSSKLDEINYSLKIYFSKDKQSIIFKVEQEYIQTHYYYEKFFLIDFKRDYKRFNMMNTLVEIFQNLKSIIDTYSTKIENAPSNKLKITISNNSEIIAIFNLRKKIRSQNRLNLVLMEQIQENRNKIKSIKKQSAKLEKNMKSQNDIINDINSKIDNINENLENLLKELNNIKEDTNNNSSSIPKRNENKKQNKINKKIKEEEIDNKKDITNKKEEGKEYEDDISLTEKETKCKKQVFYEILFILNIFIIIFIAYLFWKIKSLEIKGREEYLKIEQLKKKYSFFRQLDSLDVEDIKFLQNTFVTGEIYLDVEEKENENIREDEEKNEEVDNINELNENKNENIDNDFKDEIKNNKRSKE